MFHSHDGGFTISELLFLALICFLMLTFTGAAQDIPPDRSTKWSDAGPRTSAPRPERIVSITDCGAAADGGFPADLAITEASSSRARRTTSACTTMR